MSETFSSCFPPRPGRAHEICGPGAATFAAIASGTRGGDVLWLVEGWRTERINPLGLAPFCDPARVLTAEAANQAEMLAMAEEALRAKPVATVVAEIHDALDLTQGRRLQLAAEAGGTLGLFLIPQGKGSNAAETRWHCAPELGPVDSTRFRWEIIKNKSGTLKTWTLVWDDQTHRISVVSEAGQ